MPASVDLTGKTFNRLTAIRRVENKGRRRRWLFRCSCGVEKELVAEQVIRGTTKSCGCFRADIQGSQNRKHGMKALAEYVIWKGMRSRCLNSNNKSFRNYGGRGIGICQRWDAFMNFYEDMGPRPPGTSLDRIDNNGDYEPSNCRWATPKQQAVNQRRTVRITSQGETKTIDEWADEIGVSPKTIRWRQITGLPIEDVLATKHLRYGYSVKRDETEAA